MRDVVLIVSNEQDPHADAAVQRLNELGARVVRWHTSDFPTASKGTFAIGTDTHADGVLDTGVRRARLSEIRSAWLRRPHPPLFPADFDPFWLQFAKAQATHFTHGLWQADDWFWISRPSAIRSAEFKINQLVHARRHGFRVPPTIITNDVEQARAFCAAQGAGGVIFKPLTIPPIELTHDTDKGGRPQVLPLLFVSPLTDDQLSHLDSLRWAPGIIQRYVDKAFELRVTIIAGVVFAVEIHSQEHPRTVHDWRRYPDDLGEVRHVPHRLPDAIEAGLKSLVRSLGLNFGAVDMIVTPDGEYVFLEVNPNGQFLWLEDLTGLPMLDTLVKALIRGRPLA